MAPLRRAALLATTLTAALAAPTEAAAFCGFYVAGADSKLLNHATVVVLMREGNRTILSMQNNYDGPPEKFAMVVPVPVVLRKDDVKTLPSEVFRRVDELTAPRLVEYWEQDPCKLQTLGLVGTGRGGGGTGDGYGRGAGLGFGGVRVEAEFAVGEYEIVILSAADALGLEGWLKANRYVIPDGAAQHLQPYVAGGAKFFVAKVDPKKVKFDDRGMAKLSPLRMHYPSDDFRLPIRLGLINADGPQDLIVHILSPAGRFEAANYPNVTLPTEIVVKNEIRASFGAFYAALFDGLLARNPGAVVTEYAWDAQSCDPCPDEPLTGEELATLGLDVLAGGLEGLPGISQPVPTADGPLHPEIVRRVMRAHLNEVRYCDNQARKGRPHFRGDLRVEFTVNERGKVSGPKVTGGAAADGLDACVASAVRRWSFPKQEQPTRVVASLGLAPVAGPRGFVLTRLHTRYDATTLGEDLVFREAPPIANGSQGGEGPFVQEAVQAPINRFQGRFIIQHAWTGPVACVNPIRGMYGGPPAGQDAPKPTTITDAAFAPRDGTDVATCVETPIVALGGAPAPLAPPPTTQPQAPLVPIDPPPPPPAAGCGCRGDADPALPLVLAPLLLRRRRPSASLPRKSERRR